MTGRPDDDLVGAFYRAYNTGDAPAAAALYAEDGWHQEGMAGPRREGRAALRDGLKRFFGMLPDARWQVRESISSGPVVAVVYTMTGTLGIDVAGKPTRGRAIELPGIHLFEIADGALLGTRDIWDPASFHRQLEAVPA